jgi:hypothetical protein
MGGKIIMANTKISGLTSATTPLAGTEVLPIVQSNTTKQVSVANLTAGRNVAAAKVSVNTTSTASNVVVGRSAPGQGIDHGLLFVDQTNNNLAVISVEGYSTNDLQLLAGAGIRIYTNSNLASSGLVAQISTAGDMTLNVGNLIPGTAGKGINFTANTPASGMTSQLLNWYEEGTWTPTGGSIGATGSSGTYTRIGRQVTVNAIFTGTSISFGSSSVICSNLPFSAPGNFAGAIIDTGSTQGAFVRASGVYIISCSAMPVPVTSVAATVTYNI